MSARDIAGIAGVIFVLTSAVSIFAELIDSAGATGQALRLAAYGVAALLLAVAYVVHRRERRPSGHDRAVPADQGVPAQRGTRTSVRSR